MEAIARVMKDISASVSNSVFVFVFISDNPGVRYRGGCKSEKGGESVRRQTYSTVKCVGAKIYSVKGRLSGSEHEQL